ncbi:MAG: hypothetical protein GXY38_02140 [Planctomycetes bacterium]|nr:hypothetical protein [Planctomycetota bacterium]
MSMAILLLSVFFSRDTRTWYVNTEIGGRPAVVTITWILPWHVALGPQDLVRWGEDKYRTKVDFGQNEDFSFVTSSEPKAIWLLNDRYYAACKTSGKDWLIVLINAEGRTKSISENDLPDGDRRLNLVPEEDWAEWQKDFERWAK